jgi:hypothetical protein
MMHIEAAMCFPTGDCAGDEFRRVLPDRCIRTSQVCDGFHGEQARHGTGTRYGGAQGSSEQEQIYVDYEKEYRLITG